MCVCPTPLRRKSLLPSIMPQCQYTPWNQRRIRTFDSAGGTGGLKAQEPVMCDYSLEMYGSRPAREGEIYVTTRFPSGSIGFASAGDPRTAVCMQCDTKVMLTDIPPALRTALRVDAEVETTFAQREA